MVSLKFTDKISSNLELSLSKSDSESTSKSQIVIEQSEEPAQVPVDKLEDTLVKRQRRQYKRDDQVEVLRSVFEEQQEWSKKKISGLALKLGLTNR